MQIAAIVAGVVAFIVVAGYAGFSWLRHGRDPTYADDSSILMPAPPPEMTAATATIIDGGPTRTAFMAALLDLASRDEIGFRDEGRAGGRDLVGIEIHGGESTDARVLLNRRRPVGEGEGWLLMQLRDTELVKEVGGQRHSPDELPSPEQVAAMSEGMQNFLHFMTLAGTATGEGPNAEVQHEHGLFSGPAADPQELAAAYEARTGKPMGERTQQSFARMSTMAQLMQNPGAAITDPNGFANRVEAATGRPLTPEQMAQVQAWARASVARNGQGSAPAAMPAQGVAHPPQPAFATNGGPAFAPGTQPAPAPATPRGPTPYISGRAALSLGAPIFLGTMLQQYAIRHGWIAGLPFLRRLRWHLIAAAEIAVALGLLIVSAGRVDDVLTGLGVGIGAGGVVTWLMAPAMASRTREGAMMRAQLAAYRRTLQMTFQGSRSMDAAVGTTGLPWLETPDQALVWGIALGLRADVEALLGRTAADMAAGRAAATTYVPAWYGPAGMRSVQAGQYGMPDPAAMFAGIEAVGSEAMGTQQRRSR